MMTSTPFKAEPAMDGPERLVVSATPAGPDIEQITSKTKNLQISQPGSVRKSTKSSGPQATPQRPPPPPKPTEDDMAQQDLEADADRDEEFHEVETYSDYVPAKVNIGCPHPDPVVETSSLSTVEPPDVTYKLNLPNDVIDKGLLSSLQLESVIYASQQHMQLMPDGRTRRGFLIGDGAGVGKGRTIAGIIYENYLCGRKRSIWLSVSTDLRFDAERDLRDIGARSLARKIRLLKEFPYGKEIYMDEGVIFTTYSGLVTKSQCVRGDLGNRLGQLVKWAGPDFDGLILFDECHKAKNMTSTSKMSKAAEYVMEIQKRLPNARVVYASATGASETRHLCYMTRLGIWGVGTAYPTFTAFCRDIERRGVGAMELVAVDLKMRGSYIARQLSFKTTSFEIRFAKLDEQFIELYDACVDMWSTALQYFKEAESYFADHKNLFRISMAPFWSSHQKFFKYLCISSKVPIVVEIAKQALLDGKCVVIGLQSTGEAKTMEALEDGDINEFVSTAKATFESLIENHFPMPPDHNETVSSKSTLFSDDDNEEAALGDEAADNKSMNPFIRHGARLIQMRDKLLDKIDELGPKLPNNTLDDLIDRLGGPHKVAEMTGRKGRVVKDSRGRISYKQRNETDSSDMMNIAEKDRFMAGEKLIAIISEAASSGISLQADQRVPNTRRRVHITIELPWSADRAIQQFGRTHRSNQLSGPEYVFIISELAGERRFASVVAQRLENLGALTHGDRRATVDSRDLSQFNISSKYCLSALKHVITAIEFESKLAKIKPDYAQGNFIRDARDAFVGAGLGKYKDKGVFESELLALKINQFLNRILGMKVHIQNAIFKLFTDYIERLIAHAKVSGQYDAGILELNPESGKTQVEDPEHYYLITNFGTVQCTLRHVKVERGITWESAMSMYENRGDNDKRSGFYVTTNPLTSAKMVLLILRDGKDTFKIYKPNTGRQPRPEYYEDIMDKSNIRKSLGEAERLWRHIYASTDGKCIHRCLFKTCKRREAYLKCDVGLRHRYYCILSGSILTAWPYLERTVPMATKKINIVRIRLDVHNRVIGPVIPQDCLELVRKALREAEINGVEKKEEDKTAKTAKTDKRDNQIPSPSQSSQVAA